MLRLLVVDDEIDTCDFMGNFFKERDFDVFAAYNGKEALRLVESINPDIILLDLKMPVMDGMEALRRIREKDDAVKIIVVTAVADEEKVEEAKAHGVTDYITKPLLLERLERSVRMAAEQIRMDSA